MTERVPCIAVRNLCAGYGAKPVLRDVNLDIAPGEMTGLLGPNGSGKSTLLRVLSGVLPPESGTVCLQGRDLYALAARRRARLCATVAQRNPGLSETRVAALVLMGRYPYISFLGGYTEQDHLLARQAMEATGVWDLRKRAGKHLSGGELQRTVLARALAQGAEILLLDEAASNLDVARTVEFHDLLHTRNAQGLTVLTVGHDLNLAALYCRRLIFLKQGRILHDGPTAEVFTAKVLSEIYETPIRVAQHPITGAPQAYLVPASRAVDRDRAKHGQS